METPKSPPVCVVFAHLPAGMKTAENVNYDVRFNGYFFKRYWYLTAERKPTGELKGMGTLFFFAPTVELPGTERAGGDWGPIPGTILTGIFVLAVITISLVVGLNLLFRRSDAKVQAKVKAARDRLLAAREEAGELGGSEQENHADVEKNSVYEAGHPAAPAEQDDRGNSRFPL